MSFENGDGRRIDQSVIVTQNWYDEKLIERIEKKFGSMNGHPNELKIKLYYSDGIVNVSNHMLRTILNTQRKNIS